jgi:integration host factor subunit beta
MTKSELIETLTQKLRHLSRMEVEIIVDTVFNQMKDALKNHNRVELRGFGIFEVRHRKARAGRNPKSGVTVQVQNRYVPFFKVGKELRDRVNGLPETAESMASDAMRDAPAKVAANA